MSVVLAAAVGAAASALAGKPKKLKNIGKAKKAWLDAFIADSKLICSKNNIPFQVCVTQAALESGWGSKAPGFNYFGIKGSGDAGTQFFIGTEILNGVKVKKKMGYAKFSSIAAGIQGYCNVMNNNDRFKPAVKNFSDDPVDFFIWIWSAGYATSKDYVASCLGVMSVIYRATGDESFNVSPSKSRKSLINKLKSKKTSAQRISLAASELGISGTKEVAEASNDSSEVPVTSLT